MACANYWTTPLQVGSHHIARAFRRKGWEVAFLSDPISPLHLLKPSPGLKSRFALYKQGGMEEENVWSYVPGALLSPYNHSLLKSSWLHKHWHYLTIPSLLSKVKRKGFDKPDLLYFDSPLQAFWLNKLCPKYAIYRLADYNSAFAQTSPAKKMEEEKLLAAVDCVIYTAKGLEPYIESLHPKRMEFVPNGVDFVHFSQKTERPDAFKHLKGPIAIYVGALREWFDSKLVSDAAEALPEMHFVIIGPNETCTFKPLPNLHLLGAKSWHEIPAYLQHATVGIIPFNVKEHPELIHCVNPLKLYEYMASGLPVVSMKWEELSRLNSPALLASNREEFIKLLQQATPSETYRAFAEKHDWSHRGEQIIELCHNH